jgi:hypothetical protein
MLAAVGTDKPTTVDRSVRQADAVELCGHAALKV